MEGRDSKRWRALVREQRLHPAGRHFDEVRLRTHALAA
jgi:hypothetical protein